MTIKLPPLLAAFLFLLGAGNTFPTSAQEIADPSVLPFFIRSWEAGQGLPSSAVTAVTQTRDGYLWVGTDAGLARFDGVKSRVFGLAEGLKNLQISTLLEDKSGALWIGTAGGGLGRLVDGKIQTFTIKDGLAGDSISSLLENTNGDIWVGTHTGLSVWHNGKFEAPDKKTGAFFIFDLAKDHHGNIWVATLYNGLLRFRDGQFSVADGESGMIITNNPRCLLVDSQDRVWAGLRERKVLRYADGNITLYGTNEGFPEVILNRLAQTADGTIWAGSADEGLFYFQNGQFNGLRKKDGLPDDAILSLYADKERLLWIGTQSGGLGRLGPKKLSAYHVMDGTSEAVVRSLAKTTNGDLWVGAFGQGVYNWQGTQFDHIQIGPVNPYSSHLLVETLLGAGDGTLWTGAAAHLYQTRDGKLIYHADERPFAGDRIWCLSEAQGGGIWIGTFNGQLRLLKDKKNTAVKGLDGKPITTLVQQGDGTLWIGSLGDGLLQLKDGKITSFTTKDGLGSDLIRTLSLDADGTLWIGMDGGGLTRYANGKFDTFTTKQGLVSDTVLQILSDDDGSLWLGCNQGICRVSKRVISDVADGRAHALHPLVLGVTDGMPSEECVGSFGAALKTDDGLLRFSTTKGIVVIDPRKQLTHIGLPTVAVEEVLMDGRPLTASSRDTQTGVPVFEATPGRHNFEIHYTGLSFNAPERVQFKYQLEGWDEDWVEAGGERIARYNVPPGNYHFRVIACNSNGLWNEIGAGIILDVPPNLWQSFWFRLLAGLILLALVALIVRRVERRRYRTRLKRLEQEQAMDKERSRIARDLHDELGSSLTYISMSVNDLEPAAGSDEQFKKQRGKISTFAVRTARSLDEIVWAINPHNDSLRNLLSYLTQFTREQFESSDVKCRFQIPTDLPELPLPPELRHNIFLTVKEALNNVQKYAKPTEVCLAAKTIGSQVEISVQDDGIGFDLNSAPAKQERNGLTNMRQRVETVGGKFNIETAPGKGTTIRLLIPTPAIQGTPAK
jgi:ligand-binding sensor domain-containing protein/signal transduction histidine kinase